MIKVQKHTFKVPVYSIPYIVYGNDDTLSPEDIQECDNFLKTVKPLIKTHKIWLYDKESFEAETNDVNNICQDVLTLNLETW